MKSGMGPFLLLLQAIASYVSVSQSAGVNPPVLRAVFLKNHPPGTSPPSAIKTPTNHSRNDVPLVYCLESDFPSDVLCDVRELLASDAFAESMKISFLTLDVPYPESENKSCGIRFHARDGESAMVHEETECGLMRDHPEIAVEKVKEGLDGIMEDFNFGKVIDMSIISYTPGFGCKYRLRPIDVSESGVKVLELNSFYCMVNFGSFDLKTIPKMKYPMANFYKHDGEKWISKGIWPDHY